MTPALPCPVRETEAPRSSCIRVSMILNNHEMKRKAHAILYFAASILFAYANIPFDPLAKNMV